VRKDREEGMNPDGGSDLVTEKLRQALYLLNLCVCVCDAFVFGRWLGGHFETVTEN